MLACADRSVGAYPTVDDPFFVRVGTQVRERYGTITTTD